VTIYVDFIMAINTNKWRDYQGLTCELKIGNITLRATCLFSSIQTIVPITSGQAFLKYPDTVPAASGHHYRMIRPTAGTLCL